MLLLFATPLFFGYRNSDATTETYEFPDRSHFTGGEPGWEQAADYALEWATGHAQERHG